jgi:phosphoheptose isomerase
LTNPNHPIDFVAAHFKDHTDTVSQSLQSLGEPIANTAALIIDALSAGRKMIAFGNGGSAAQASHLVGELIGRFHNNRNPLPALALAADSGVVTCIANDFGYAGLFERQVNALANQGDIVIGLTTSGRSENVLRGLSAARQKGALTIMLTGDLALSESPADHVLRVASPSTACVQEIHLMVIHIWCMYIDAKFYE